MSEVAAHSENQENCVQAKNDELVAEPVPANNIILKEASSAEVGETTASTDAVAVAAEDEVGASPPKEDAAEATATTSPKVENKKTPVKRTPSKRLSFIEKAQRESEELVKNLGGSLELEGGRRTRSSTRGTPTRSAVVATPPPAKKSRASPAASSSTATTPSRRGRGRKIDTSSDPTDVEAATEENKKSEAAEETTSEKGADNNDAEKSSVENAENSVVDAANSAAAAEEQEASENLKKNDDIKINATASAEKDTADAALDSIPEEKQNNIDHNLTEERKNDSPMDTDEEPKCVSDPGPTDAATVEDAKEKPEPSKAATSVAAETLSSTAETTATVVVEENQPTPEPMEVDSASSKDNEEDIESAPNSAENMDKEIPVKAATDSSEASAADISVSSKAPETHKTVESAVSAAEAVKDVEDKSSNVGADIDSVSESAVKTYHAEPALVNDLKIAVAADPADPAASGEPQATTNATLETTTDTNKSENDLCEPKIVSPPTTDGAVAATPQYCN